MAGPAVNSAVQISVMTEGDTLRALSEGPGETVHAALQHLGTDEHWRNTRTCTNARRAEVVEEAHGRR